MYARETVKCIPSLQRMHHDVREKAMPSLLKRLPLLLLLICSTVRIASQPSAKDSLSAGTYQLAPDSSNFVTASIVLLSETNALYSVFGHATLRMECPIHNLDYVFTYESDTNVGGFMTFIAGKAKARYVAVPTNVFLKNIKKEGRGVRQYELNLTLHEKQELWRLLDEEMMAGAYRHFNLLTSNCLSTTIYNIEGCLVDDEFKWGPARHPITLRDGDFLRHHLHGVPWAEFVYVTFLGTIYDNFSPREHKLSPKLMIELLREARLVSKSDGKERPVIVDQGKTLCEESVHEEATAFTPFIAFSLLLAIALLITLADWYLGQKRLAKWFDITLFTAQAIVGVLIIFITFYSELFGSNWNWYIVEFAPIPLLFILIIQRKSIESKCWLAYSAILLLFILATPFLGELDLPHQLITGVLLIRSIRLGIQCN